jgi:hypothetical protein
MARATPPTHPNGGSALTFSVVAVMVVSVLAAGFLQLSLSVTRRLSSAADTQQALNLAEAGLAEAYTGLGVARTGNVGTPESPAVFGGGLFWVEAEEHASGLVELECTAMYGTGRATLGLACEPVEPGVASLGFFVLESLRLSPDVRVDSYDSSQGTYAEQVNTPLNNQALIGSNGDIAIGSGDMLFGDAVYGPTGTVSLGSGAVVTGGTWARPVLETLPPIEVPDIVLAAPLSYTSATPMVVPPGEAGFQGLDIGKNTKLVLKGPLTMKVGSLTLGLGAEMVFDTLDGPIELYVTESLNLLSDSIVSTTTQITSDTLVLVAAPAGKTVSFGASSQFYGFLYAPKAEVHVAAKFEIHGGLVCRALQLAAQGRMHLDLALGPSLESRLPLVRSWRVVELPQAAAAQRMDPFRLLDLDPGALLPPAEKHQDQLLELRYVGHDGVTHTYFGLESAFDWGLVKELLYGTRDGEVFFQPDAYVPKGALRDDPMVDLVESSLSSKELRDELLAAAPVSAEALMEACKRDPPMSSSDLEAVLDAHSPLASEVLLTAVASPALTESSLTNVLIDNSPLPPEVLDAALNRSPPLSTSSTNELLSKQ